VTTHGIGLAGLICAAVLLAGCADRTTPTAPPAAPSLASGSGDGIQDDVSIEERVGVVERVTVLRRTRPLPADLTASAVIDSRGGRIEIREAGLRIDFRENAVRAPTRITVTALAGDGVAYEFGPHGLVFGGEVRVEQRLDATTAKDDPLVLAQLEAGYFELPDYGDGESGTALVREIIPVSLDVSGSAVKFRIEHFSGYLLASGRTR
jgi:hypothetical protein